MAIRDHITGGVILGAGAAFILATALGTTGCSSLGDWIKVQVPPAIQDGVGATPKVSLNDSRYVREAYIAEATRAIKQFDGAIAGADMLRDWLADLADTGLTAGSSALAGSGFPLGGAAALALGGLGGLFLRKPGDAGKMKEAEQRGRLAGKDEAVSLLATPKSKR